VAGHKDTETQRKTFYPLCLLYLRGLFISVRSRPLRVLIASQRSIGSRLAAASPDTDRKTDRRSR